MSARRGAPGASSPETDWRVEGTPAWRRKAAPSPDPTVDSELAKLLAELLEDASARQALLGHLRGNAVKVWFVRARLSDTSPDGDRDLAEPRQIVGCLLAEVVGSRLHILQLGVAARAQGEGAGRALLRCAIVWAVAAELDSVVLEVRESNEPAQSLYESFGFVAVELRPRYYPDGDGAVSMCVSLVDVANPPPRT